MREFGEALYVTQRARERASLFFARGCIDRRLRSMPYCGFYLTSPQAGPRYLELKVKSMFMV